MSENIKRDNSCLEALSDIYLNKAYSNIALTKVLNNVRDESDRAFITRLFYGVIEYDYQYEYIISVLAPNQPKPLIKIILKMGLYMQREMKTPDYAVNNRMIDLYKSKNKMGAKGFINAFLLNSAKFVLPQDDSVKSLAIRYSVPEWFVKILIKDYGKDFTSEFLGCKLLEKTHIRFNSKNIKKDDFEPLLGANYTKTPLGYYVTRSTLIKINPKFYVPMSYSSMLAVQYYLGAGFKNNFKVLDLCGAPGGKSIYLKELADCDITICDIHKHRLELIRSYCKKTNVELNIVLNDAAEFNRQWENAFDLVICDVPCSGSGVIKSKPDIVLSRKYEDVQKLVELQLKILTTASKYVKNGGALCYSTCSVFKRENQGIVNTFLNAHNNFKLDNVNNEFVQSNEQGFMELYPQTINSDGFFAARLIRKD